MKPWRIAHGSNLFGIFYTNQNWFSCHLCLILVILGARFEFILDEELKVAAACMDVKTALAAKISKERIGTEVCLKILLLLVKLDILPMEQNDSFSNYISLYRLIS